jgi:hypothetical protein
MCVGMKNLDLRSKQRASSEAYPTTFDEQSVSKQVTNMKPRDLSLVLKNAPAGEWIALSFDQNRIMGHGETVDDAVMAARLAGEDKPVLLKMPLPNVGIAAHLSQP